MNPSYLKSFGFFSRLISKAALLYMIIFRVDVLTLVNFDLQHSIVGLSHHGNDYVVYLSVGSKKLASNMTSVSIITFRSTYSALEHFCNLVTILHYLVNTILVRCKQHFRISKIKCSAR